MTAGQTETANDFKTKRNSFCKDCIAGVIHPKINFIDRRVASQVYNNLV